MKEFSRVVGYEDIKIELYRIVDMMINPDKYRKLGVKTTRGLLFVGNPGLGKTLMANCMIEASKRKSYVIKRELPTNEFIAFIKDTFREAKENAPSIVLLDDIDKFGKNPRSEEFSTVQACIDSCNDSEVFFLATANNENNLPDSLKREGRFDKTIYFDVPCSDDVGKIVEYYLSDKKCSSDLNYMEIAYLLNGDSCAALETILNEAGVYAGFDNRDEISMDDIVKAFMRKTYNAPEKLEFKDSAYFKELAYHEAGHAVVGEVLEKNSVLFVNIVPNNSAAGGFVHLRSDDDYFKDKKFMENRVISLLAGKAATEMVFGKTDTGASFDISRANKIVGRFISDQCSYGFGFMSCAKGDNESGDLLNRTNIAVNLEMERYYQKAKQIIIENRECLDRVAKELMDKRVLLSSDIQRLMEVA